MRNPLAPTVFLLRNTSKTLPLIGVIVLAVMLIGGIVAIMDSIPLSIRTTYGYSKAYLGVSPRGNMAMTPILRHIVKTESPVPLGRVMTCRVSDCEVKSIVGPWRFAVIGLSQDDMSYYLDRLGGCTITGRLPLPGKAEALLSEPVARNLGKKLGDVFLGPTDSNNYSPNEVRVVGIAHMKPWVALAPIEYLEKYHFPPIDLLIVTAKDIRQQDKLDHWAYERLGGEMARTYTYFRLEIETADMFKILYTILNVVIALLVVVITLMMAMLMNIYQSQRLQEFGLLQALGYARKRLMRRVLSETALVVAGGWILGVVSAFLLMTVVKVLLMDPRAFMLDPFDRQAYLYSVPVPIAIFLAATWTIALRFRRFDPVGVVERRLV